MLFRREYDIENVFLIVLNPDTVTFYDRYGAKLLKSNLFLPTSLVDDEDISATFILTSL